MTVAEVDRKMSNMLYNLGQRVQKLEKQLETMEQRGQQEDNTKEAVVQQKTTRKASNGKAKKN